MSGEIDQPALVLGGTSLVGRFLLPLLTERRLAFHALSREPREGRGWILGDLGSDDLAGRLPTCPTVFSLSPIWLLPPALPTLFERGVKRLVAFSSTSRFTKQDSPDPAERETARKLAEAEARTEWLCAEHGVAWTILRPTLIYAEGQDANVSRLAGLIRRFGVLPLVGSGKGLRQPVHGSDLAVAALAAAASPAAFDKAYDLPGGETLTYREMAARVFEGLGKRPRLIAVPPALWRLGFRLAAPLLPGANAQMGARMERDLTFDPAPAARDFGWRPRPFRPKF